MGKKLLRSLTTHLLKIRSALHLFCPSTSSWCYSVTSGWFCLVPLFFCPTSLGTGNYPLPPPLWLYSEERKAQLGSSHPLWGICIWPKPSVSTLQMWLQMSSFPKSFLTICLRLLNPLVSLSFPFLVLGLRGKPAAKQNHLVWNQKHVFPVNYL